MVVGLIGSAALPSMARKVKVKHVAQQAVAVKDSLSPNDRKRFEYFFLEAEGNMQPTTILLRWTSLSMPDR